MTHSFIICSILLFFFFLFLLGLLNTPISQSFPASSILRKRRTDAKDDVELEVWNNFGIVASTPKHGTWLTSYLKKQRVFSLHVTEQINFQLQQAVYNYIVIYICQT